jgi:hypothetical protein
MTIVYLFAALIFVLACASAWAWGIWAFAAVLLASMLGLWMAVAAVRS